jgi:hypothetical protein
MALLSGNYLLMALRRWQQWLKEVRAANGKLTTSVTRRARPCPLLAKQSCWHSLMTR